MVLFFILKKFFSNKLLLNYCQKLLKLPSNRLIFRISHSQCTSLKPNCIIFSLFRLFQLQKILKRHHLKRIFFYRIITIYQSYLAIIYQSQSNQQIKQALMMIQRSDSLLSDVQESQKLQLFISCRNLPNFDVLTTTDSFLVVHLIEPTKPQKQIMKTKIYWNDLNPNYAETVLIDFIFQVRQKLIFEVFHEAKPAKLVGRTETSLGEIFGSPEHGLVRDLEANGKKQGKIVIRCQKQEKTVKKFLSFQIKARNLPSIKTWWFFGGTCAFFRIVRKRNKDELLVYESETINNTTEPAFREFRLSEQKLSKNDDTRAIQIRFYNFSNVGNHELLGSATFSLKQLDQMKQFKLMKAGQQRGTVVFDTIKKSIQYSFSDYINANLQLALVTCIDFTASNGKATSKESLHYCNNQTQSVYEKALTQVTNILMNYDYDKLVPVYGFGARVNHPNLDTKNKVHHCFPINGRVDNPNLYGIEEMVKEYRNVLRYTQFSGPTYFAELLKEAIAECKQFQKYHNQYMILFILTDGQIHDRQQTIDLIVSCNRLPISVIIVGVGNGEFAIMHELDDDDCNMMDSNGKKTERDLVQFVEFKNFKNNGVELAREVLEELPRQVSEYYQLMGLTPDDIVNSHQGKEDDIARLLREMKGRNPESSNSSKGSLSKVNPYY